MCAIVDGTMIITTDFSQANMTNDSYTLFQQSILSEFHHFHAIVSRVLTAITIIGVVGHAANLLTMYTNKTMRTPSFIYLKALSISELVYNVNVLVTTIVLQTRAPDSLMAKPRVLFPSQIHAYYFYTVSRIVSSVTGYMILYMTLVITFERFVALQYAHHYRRINRRIFALRTTLICLFISDIINSWHSFFEHRIIEQTLQIEVDNATMNETWYGGVERSSPRMFVIFTRIKDGYNVMIRVTYPILLIIFMVGATRGFCRFVNNSSFLQRNNRKIRREYTLVYYMIAIVILAVIQVVPREIRRVMELAFPRLKHRMTTPEFQALPYHERAQLFRLYIIISGYIVSVGNISNAIGRSFTFYLNMLLNKTFRTAFKDQCQRHQKRVNAESEYFTTAM